ncbi:hypothetical protein FQN57_004510 [Myotisia sp. PD_48]|nr:hypothetical protein FQN57_004510 [Myotisia sp. PD_48]
MPETNEDRDSRPVRRGAWQNSNWRVRCGSNSTNAGAKAENNSSLRQSCSRSDDQQLDGGPELPNPTHSSKRQPSDEPHGSCSTNNAFLEGRRLYVGNLPYMAKREDVLEFFGVAKSADGDIQENEFIDMSIDPFTSRNPSYCFVELATSEQAKNAMAELDGKFFLGRPAKIKPGVPKKSNGPARARRDQPADVDQHRRRTSAPDAKCTYDRWTQTNANEHWFGYALAGKRLHVSGLLRMPNHATADYEVRNVFQGFKIEAISKIIPPRPDHRSASGNDFYLFVDFESAEEAGRAVHGLHDTATIKFCPLRLQKARGNSWKVFERQQWDSEHSGLHERPNNDDITVF